MVQLGGMNMNRKVIGAFLEDSGWAASLSTVKIAGPH